VNIVMLITLIEFNSDRALKNAVFFHCCKFVIVKLLWNYGLKRNLYHYYCSTIRL